MPQGDRYNVYRLNKVQILETVEYIKRAIHENTLLKDT